VNDENKPPHSEPVAHPKEQASSGAELKGPAAPAGIPPILLEGDETALPTVAGTEQKYALGPAAQAPNIEESELPQTYGTGGLLLAARDPHCLYAHWDLSGEQLRVYSTSSRDEHLVLRIHLDNVAGKQVSELPISANAQHAFAHVDHAGATYAADFGYYEAGGQWKSLSASGSVRTPVETFSEEKEVQFATLPGEPAPPQLVRVENTMVQTTVTDVPLQHSAAAPPSPVPVRAELPPELTQDFPAEELGLQFQQIDLEAQTKPGEPRQSTKPTAKELTQQLPPRFAPAVPGKWTLAHEKALAELIGWTVTRRDWPSSAEIAELIGRRPEVFSLELVELGFPGFSPVSISSPAGGDFPYEKGFWFNVNAELVIYGATEPNAQLTIGGRAVQLRPDGTFSFRFALPDGTYALPLTAHSAQGEMRAAELEFFRGTKYSGEVGQHPPDPTVEPPPLG
jgi:hypothetical protein